MGFLLVFFIKPKNPTQPPRKLGFFPSLTSTHFMNGSDIKKSA